MNKDSVLQYALSVKHFNFQTIATHFGCGNGMEKKERYNLQRILFALCDEEKLKYSTKSHEYYTMGYYKKVMGKK